MTEKVEVNSRDNKTITQDRLCGVWGSPGSISVNMQSLLTHSSPAGSIHNNFVLI